MNDYPLRQLYFYLTEGCNLACRHCWLAPKFDPDGSRYATLPVDIFEKTINEAIPLGLTGVKLTGGEPLLHPEITELLSIVKDSGLGLTIETNGVLCNTHLTGAIAGVGKPFVSVSLDGASAESHEWMRGVPGSFEQTLTGIRNLIADGIRPQIIFSIMRHNVGEAEAIITLAENLGASSIKFNLIQPTARGEALHEHEQTLTIYDMIELGHRVENEYARKTDLKLIYDYPPAFRSLRFLTNGNDCSVCGIKGILGVLPDGKYALCGIGEHLSELVFGDAKTDPLEEVWGHTTLQTIRDGLPDQLTGICGDCLMKGRCLGSCLAQNYYRTGELFASNWFCEAADNEGHFPASRRM